MKQTRIAICGLIESPNLGDKFIADSLEYIIRNEFQTKKGIDNLLIKQVKIAYAEAFDLKKSNIFDYLYKISKRIGKVCNWNPIRSLFSFICHSCWKRGNNYGIKCKNYFINEVSDVDIIIVSGGGLLEYSYNEYQELLLLISIIAAELHIPIVYNAVGIAGDFDPKDYRCQILMKAMHSSQIKYVSARDSREIVQQYVGERLHVEQRADAAVLLDEAYGISAKKSDNPIIGIGLIRGTALQSYHINFGREKWICLFASIAEELSSRGYRFCFFTNGLQSDYDLGIEVLQRLKLPNTYLVERPTNTHVLADTISGFSAMITCRMHSAIAGFSMGIPAVVLSWNTKLNKFMELIDCTERAVNVDHFDACYIVDIMEKAMREGYSPNQLAEAKELARESVRGYIDLIQECGTINVE